jgi:urease accessory protein
MLVVQRKLDAPARPDADLVLPFELRQKSRLRTSVAGGEEIGLFLDRGSVLRGGECLVADDGRVVRVVAADEDLLEVRCASPEALARAAYHLGNRHTPVEVGAGRLRIAADAVLAEMLRGLGAAVTAVSAPFEPERGAYAAGHHAHSGEAKHAGIIHDLGANAGPATGPVAGPVVGPASAGRSSARAARPPEGGPADGRDA